MANYENNYLRIIGLQEKPDDFAKALETEMYGHVVPNESGNFFVEVVDGAFEYVTKREPRVDALKQRLWNSKKGRSHCF